MNNIDEKILRELKEMNKTLCEMNKRLKAGQAQPVRSGSAVKALFDAGEGGEADTDV